MKTMLLFISFGLLGPLAAEAQNSGHPRYTVTDLGTLGGNFSTPFGINSAGHVAGASNLTKDGPAEAFIWEGGHLNKLGTLGGPNSAANGPNARGDAAVDSETSQTDPNGEDVCRHGTHKVCLAAVWNGALTPLPTLGGNNAQAFALNNRSEIVGLAENTKKEPAGSCATASQVLDFEAVPGSRTARSGNWRRLEATRSGLRWESMISDRLSAHQAVVRIPDLRRSVWPLDSMLCSGKRTAQPVIWATWEAKRWAKPAPLITGAKWPDSQTCRAGRFTPSCGPGVQV